jgi:hypothetical protein
LHRVAFAHRTTKFGAGFLLKLREHYGKNGE